jgi:ABC-2 type transport system ATP-binding protein
MIEAHNVIKNYGNISALVNFELSAETNSIHAIIGPNGSGKSTVIKILSTEIRPDSGDISINGVPIANTKEIRSMVSVVPDLSRLPDNKSPRKLLWEAGKSSRLSREEIQYRIDVLAGTLEFVGDIDRRMGEMSKGMKRRVSIGMALICDSQVLLMDGSLAELDPGFGNKFMEMIKESHDKTVIVTANNMNFIDKVCDSVTIIRNGATMMNESMTSIRSKIGRPGVLLKISPMNVQRVAALLRQQLFANRIATGEDSIMVEVDDILHIPAVIRMTSNYTEVYEAKQTMTSLEDMYHAFIES